MSVSKFLAYNNAVPVAISVMLLGAGSIFAATNPEAIYSSQQQVLSVDNSYIADKDLSSYTPKVEITGVTEDSDTYYVAYKFFTIDLKDYVWQEVAKTEEMKVSKADLGPYRDLGVYVTGQLKQIVDREGMRLKETQEIERKNVTHKVVATAYGGLVGKFLDSTTEELPGYTPVVTPPAPPPAPIAEAQPAQPASNTDSSSQSQTAAVAVPNNTQAQTQPAAQSGDTTPPVIQILGNNPSRIAIGSTYGDLGAVVTDNVNTNLGIRVFLNGVARDSVIIDTSKAGEWTVRYESSDRAGNLGTAERKVIVFDPFAQESVATSTTSVQPEDVVPATPTPEPATAQATTTPVEQPGSTGQASAASTTVPIATPANTVATSTDSTPAATSTVN